MGQYYKPACPDTSEYLDSHTFGDGLKLMEFGSGTAMLSGIAALVALPSEDERGSWTGTSPLLGAWAAKRLVITGDYADEGRFVPPEFQDKNLYSYLSDQGKDISKAVMGALGEVAGPGHPMAARLRLPEGNGGYWYEAPVGMGEYLDLTKAPELQFESFKQLHLFGFQEVGLTPEEQLRNFSEALRFIALKFDSRRRDEISGLQVKVSEDGMRVESIQFLMNGSRVRWAFPLSVESVYVTLGILAPDYQLIRRKAQ